MESLEVSDDSRASSSASLGDDVGKHGFARCVASLFGGFCATLAVGAVYAWGAIAHQIGDYNYGVEDKLVMGTMCSLAVYVTPHMGCFFDTYGPQRALILGTALTVGGWLLTRWGILQQQPAWVIGCYLALCSQGVQPCVLCALDNVRNFPARWLGVCNAGVMTGFGLTAIVVAQVSRRFFDHDLPGLLLFMASATALLLLLQLTLFAAPPPAEYEDGSVDAVSHLKMICQSTEANLFRVSLICFGMALFLFVVNVSDLAAAARSDHSPEELITVFGLCNVIARPAIGLTSDLVPFSRAELLALGLVLASIAMALLGAQQMLMAAIAMGLCDGFMFAIFIPLAREMHGSENFGITFSLYLLMLGVGDVFVNFILGETVFPAEATSRMGGKDVFITALACSLLMLIGASTALILHRRLVRAAVAMD